MAAMTVEQALAAVEAALRDIPWPTPDADQALATLREAAKDAERYRHLFDCPEPFCYRGDIYDSKQEADAAIDAAMGVQP